MSSKKSAVKAPAVPQLPVVDPSALSYNIKQLGAVLGLSEWQARTLVWEGKIPALKIGRNLVVRRADVEAFLANSATLRPCNSEWMQKRKASVEAHAPHVRKTAA